MYPRLNIDTGKYRSNVERMQKLLDGQGLSMMAVTKVFRADPRLVEIIKEVGVPYIADSRIENLKTIATDAKKVLLRLPSMHETDAVVLHSDISLNSEIETVKKLNESARRFHKTHSIILMVDIGDLREGIYDEDEVFESVKAIMELSNIDLYGLGTNITCYGGVLPTDATLDRFDRVVNKVEAMIGKPLPIISGGNSSHLAFLDSSKHHTLTNLRIGEALALGRETSFGNVMEGFFDDVFTLEVDIIELKNKPSYPEGEIGMNAFGKKPDFKDLGTRKRAILAIGKQDVDHRELIPVDPDIKLIGSSSDHVIADITLGKERYKLGDTLVFKLTYGSLLSLMTSPYVVKHHD
ncbi:MAG: alanine racemase [Candidatus Izemoplasmataceae bacterium]